MRPAEYDHHQHIITGSLYPYFIFLLPLASIKETADKRALSPIKILQRRFIAAFSLMNSKAMETEFMASRHGGGGDGGGSGERTRVDSELGDITASLTYPSQPKQHFTGAGTLSSPFINNNGQQDYVSKVLPSTDRYNLATRGNSYCNKSSSRPQWLKSISEELDLGSADDMMDHDEHDDNPQFRQGSSSQGPQYYGATTFDIREDDDDFEFLLDEELARDGLYRGI